MNLPNKLTMLRVIMVPFFMAFAALCKYGTLQFSAAYGLIAGVLFAVASVTDFLDGYLARKYHLVTDFGKFMDPLADKCLTTAAFIYMVLFYYFATALAPADGIGLVSLITQVLCWAVAAVTLLSGGIYLWQNRQCFMQAK